jgi:methylaspartate mutase epsilon subunit
MKLPLEMFEQERESLFRNGPVVEFALADSEARLASRTKVSVHQVLESETGLKVQPRCGVSDYVLMRDLLLYLEEHGRPDILTLTIDSYTRLNKYEKAATTPNLNGYPLVHHGHAKASGLEEMLSAPLQVRHGSPDGRLLAEISFRAGLTSFEGGGISYNLPYAKAVPVEQSLRRWQYVDRLTGLLSGSALIDRETFGPLTAVLTPPSISIAISILEMLLAVEQGVRCLTIGFPETGCLVQDVAALKSIYALCERHLELRGLERPALFISFHQWMGIFPSEPAHALALIGEGVAAAVLGGATKLINKTYQEALGVPTGEANAFSIRFCKVLSRHAEQWLAMRFPPAELEEEQVQLAREVEEILQSVYDLDRGDLVDAITRAFELGLLDIPFPASRYARGEVLPARDQARAIRYLNSGNLAFSESTLRFHRGKLVARTTADYQQLTYDIRALATAMAQSSQ